jgi:syntaxin 7
MESQISYNEALIDERDQGIAEITQQIGEVNEIFQVGDVDLLLHGQHMNMNGCPVGCSVLLQLLKTPVAQDLAVLVNDQGMMLDDIEANIERTADRTRAAGSELVRAERYQRSSRNKMCFILLIAAFVIGVIVFVIVI